jgi:hypothetical protein
MPSLFTAAISEIEGGDTFVDAPLSRYSRRLVRAAEASARRLSRVDDRSGAQSIAGAGCEWLKDALAIGFLASGKDV